MPDRPYRGRFAPSPTGPLHFGSLIAATASYLAARHAGGDWWLRIEDIDPPREAPGAVNSILHTLDAFGFEWDGPVRYQHTRLERYRAALEQLQDEHRVYPCLCSRKQLAAAPNGVYPGTCRTGIPPVDLPCSWRLEVPDVSLCYEDGIQGQQHFQVSQDIGDFVLWRADGLVAYQLATAIDDAEQGMTEVLRGADLLDSTPRQLLVQQALGLPGPTYAHHPVATGPDGSKLSKQNQALAVDNRHPAPQLCAALRFLGQDPITGLESESLKEIWAWARANWDRQRIPRCLQQRMKQFADASDTMGSGTQDFI